MMAQWTRSLRAAPVLTMAALLLIAASDGPVQIPLPIEAQSAIDAHADDRADALLRPALDACLNRHPGHGECLALLNALATVAQRREDATTQRRAATLAVAAAATHAPGSGHEFAALTHLAAALADSDTPPAAEVPGRRALAIAETLETPPGERVAMATRNLATLMTRLGRHDEAELLIRRALAIRIERDGDTAVTTLDTQRVLGVTLNEAGRISESEAVLEQVAEALAAHHSDRLLERARVEGDLASALGDAGRYDDASRHYAAAIDLWERLGRQGSEMLVMFNNAARNFIAMGDYATAETIDRAILRARIAMLSPDDAGLATSYGNLGTTLRVQGKEAEALPLLRRALEIAEQAYGRGHVRTAVYRGYLADSLPPAEAMAERRALLDIYRRDLGPGHPTTLLAMGHLAMLLNGAGEHAAAEAQLREQVALAAKTFGPENVNYADGLVQLALTLARQLRPGTLDEMRDLLDRGHRIRSAALGAAHPDTIETAIYLAQLSGDDRALTLSRGAQRGILDRVAARRGFDAQAQVELRGFAPVFTQGVAIAWRLAQRGPASTR